MGHHGQRVELCLGNQHAVKGGAVVAGQAPGDERVRDRDGQGLEAMRDEFRLKVVREVKIPWRACDTYFPGARRADQHPPLPGRDGRPGRFASLP